MRKVFDKVCRFCSDRITAELLFFAGFIPYTALLTYSTTMFDSAVLGPIPLLIRLWCLGVCAAKILIFDSYDVKKLVIVGMAVFSGVMNIVATGDMTLLILFVITISAKDISFEKIISVHLSIRLAIILVAVSAAFMGLLDMGEHLWRLEEFSESGWKHYSFGLMNTTDCAAHVFYCIVSILFLKRKNIKTTDLIIITAVSLVVFRFTEGKTDIICSLLAVLLISACKYSEYLHEKKFVRAMKPVSDRKYQLIGMTAFPVAALVSLGLCFFYDGSNTALAKLNKVLTNRLHCGHIDFGRRAIVPFGQYIDMRGWGGGNTHYGAEGYTFIDISYQNVLLTMGYVALILILGAFVYIGYKNAKEHVFILLLVCVAISCMGDHHLAELAYNPFMLATFAAVDKSKANNSYGI